MGFDWGCFELKSIPEAFICELRHVPDMES